MNSEINRLFQSVEKKQFAPFYLIDGEEAFYLDLITAFFESKILSPSEKDFNLRVFYGKDAQWLEVVNACRRFPMFAERQVVILKDASHLENLNELSAYLEKPSPSTVFLIEHRSKKTDGRSRLVKLAKEKGFYFTSEKIKDERIPDWIRGYGQQTGFHIPEKEAHILAAYLGNDLQKIANEIEKVRINVPGEEMLTAELIQKYIGINRDYNVFEMASALTSGNKEKVYRMLSYFSANPKSAPLPLVVGSFYNHFNTLYQVLSLKGKSEKEISDVLKLYGFRLKEAMAGSKDLQMSQIEDCILILSEINAKGVGINSVSSDSSLLKELIGKLEIALSLPVAVGRQ